ncbi:hypothetical protein E3E31_03600 [Thermococcus sp. M39]|uniref:hypothetical protein n=1 Tax=Thermococcus sp. M39 TaxID=1638262 RepID=UPI00143C00A6|nr:hypothetical protein [Thermococcus sp. M39]NJE07616.1 hypothetical protein [Thermococcus sp. M39]
MVSFPGFCGFIAGLLDATNRAEEFKWKISVILWLSGLVLSVLGGYFNPDFAVNSFMRLFVDYIFGFFIGDAVGIIIKVFLSAFCFF